MKYEPLATNPETAFSTDQRIQQLDILRGLAVLGIYWINIIVFGLPHGGYALPSYLGNAVNLNTGLWAFNEIMVDGVMRGLFSCLFGASALLYLSDEKLATLGIFRVEQYYRRNLFLILIGLFHAFVLLWPYDVLFAYGLIGLFLFPLRNLPAKALLIAGCLMLVIADFTVGQVSQPGNLSSGPAPQLSEQKGAGMDRQEIDQASQNLAKQEYTWPEKYRMAAVMNMQEDIALHKSSYPKLFTSKLTTTIDQQSSNMYRIYFFDIGGMMLIGMALFKLGILQGGRSRNFYIRLMLAGFLIGILSRTPSVYHEVAVEFVPTNPKDPEQLNYSITRLPVMLGYIGLLMWLLQNPFFQRIFQPLAAIGKLALTNYILQTVISIFVFYGVGLGLIGHFERYQLAMLCIAVWLVQVTLSMQWLEYFRYGPLEWLWRSAIHLKWQPLRKL